MSSIAKKEVLAFPPMNINAQVGSSCGINSASCIEAGEIILTLKNNVLKALNTKFSDTTSPAVSVDGSSGTKFKAGSFYINNKFTELKDGQSLSDIVQSINLSKIGVRAEIAKDNSSLYYIVLEPITIGGQLKIDDPYGLLGTVVDQIPTTSINITTGDSIFTVIKKFNSAAQGSATISYNVNGSTISCVLYSSLTGTTNALDMTFKGVAPSKDGSGSGRFFETFTTTQGASDANMTFDNAPIQASSSNLIKIGLPNGGDIALELLKETPSGESADFTVFTDIDTIYKKIESFIVGYAKFMHQLSKVEGVKHGYLGSFMKKGLIDFKIIYDLLSPKRLNGDATHLRDAQGNNVGISSLGIQFLDDDVGLFFNDEIEKAASFQDLEGLGIIHFSDRLLRDSIANNIDFVESLFVSGVKGSANFNLHDGKNIIDLLRKSFFVSVFFCLFFGRAFVFF